ncbi:MAG TPA: hypothetical protein VK203_10240 [Nostocaceae cyanobacterium]|nr:hypothetical protein [Nostocaceae cyanobacterium]
MPSLISGQFTKLPALSLLVGSCLVFTHLQPATAQTPQNDQLSQTLEFNQDEQNALSSQPLQVSQANQNFERYLVYVDSDDPLILERVRSIDNSAYIRPFNGKNVIQSGVFVEEYNALERARELQSNGINGVQIISFSNTEAVPFSPSREDERIARGESRRENPRYYYVVIPTTTRNLNPLAVRLRQRIGQNSNVFSRTKPRGAHIAVGPFAERPEAEQWNNYLRNLGYRDARVYYGR